MNKMNGGLNQEMPQSSPLMEEMMKEMMEKIKSLTNTVAGQGVELRALGELIKSMPAQNPVVKDLEKRMKELEINAQENLKRLEELIRDFEAGCKLIWDTAKTGEKILSNFDAFMEKMRSDFDRFIQNHSLSRDIQLLRDDMVNHIRFFQEPYHKDVRLKHHMEKTLLVIFGLVLIVLVATVLLTQAWGRAGQHDENDIKWRWIKISAGPSLLRALDGTDSVYLANPKEFTKNVILEEDRLHELMEKQLEINQAQGEVEKLEQKKRTR